ncbi:molybdate ABC transporter substrate-binding protein [Aeromicrobium sp. 179-A 4D2 NHS]|uniref:molybdate ABC transporter substrate-binding protein n=1 Tax=Aeromicrobium sp. 179-A 4D2 NHS TaxID=3142375 RepID=UPI0039A3DE25
MRRLLVLVLLASALGGCSSSSAGERRVTVLAAASLTEAFTELATAFEREHEDVDVVLSFGGSSDLAAQVVEGAPADVFAAADERTMRTVTEAGATAAEPVVFATNTLQVVTPSDDPAGVRSLRDLGRPDVKVVLCAPQVPCGAATARLLAAGDVDVAPVSEERSVTDVLGKVASGEADAGVVYVTDVLAAGESVRGVEVAEASSVVNRYPIAPLDGADDRALAQQFAAFVTSATGRRVLTAAGFGAP